MSFLDSRGLYVANLSSKFSQKKASDSTIFYSNQGTKTKADVVLNYKMRIMQLPIK
jgi:hypothetical protein